MAWSWQRCSLLQIFFIGCSLCVCLFLAPLSFAQGTEPAGSFYFTWNPNATIEIGMPARPYNASNITRLSRETDFTPGGHTLCLTQPIPANGSQYEAMGRALYFQPIRLLTASTGSALSFSTMFSFWIETPSDSSIYPNPGEGLAFIMTPDNRSTGGTGKYLGWLNETTNNDPFGHNFAIEFDIFQDPQFNDTDGHHVGVDVNSLNSTISKAAGVFDDANSKSASPMLLAGDSKASSMVYAWIEYDGSTQWLTVTINSNTAKPAKPLISTFLDLSSVLSEFMYVGFTASTGDVNQTMAQHTVYDWSFSTNGTAANVFVPYKDEDQESSPQFMVPVAVSVAVVVSLLVVILVVTILYFRYYRKYNEARRRPFQVTDLDHLEYGPQKFSYRSLSDATQRFSAKEELGRGGFGSVYKGVVPETGVYVAVKRICKKSKQGASEFMAEVKIIGRMRHRNLVPLLGFCHEKSKRELLLVYEYMPNGSLDNLLFQRDSRDGEGAFVLSWEYRVKILSGVATALQYLHEECEQRVVHRDVKASNVMLDEDFNARLGDFGLARLYDHKQEAVSTKNLAGTFGYMAPELVQDGKSTEKTDVYSFGAVALEIATGRSAAEKPPAGKSLVDWVWSLYSSGHIISAVDGRLEKNYNKEEMERVLHTGLLCSHPDPDTRPTMRQSLSYLKGEAPFPVHTLPAEKPLPMYASSISRNSAASILSRLSNGGTTQYTASPESLSVDIVEDVPPDSTHSKVSPD